MLARFRPMVQLSFAAGSAVLVYLFVQGAIAGREIEQSGALAALSPAYQGDDRRAPDFELPDQHGKKVKLSSFRGKVVVLNFWTITCGPCVEEMPSIEAAADILKEDDVVVLTVTVDEGWETVRQLFPRGTRLPVLFDPERKVVTDRYGTRLFPETWIIDRAGIIRARFDGAKQWNGGVALSYVRSLT